MKRLTGLVVATVVAAAAVPALAGCAGTARANPPAAEWNAPTSPDIDDDAAGLPDPPSPSASPSPSARPSPSHKPSPSPSRSTAATLVVLGVTFNVASGGTGVHGSGARHLRYKVAVQSGLSESTSSVAGRVDYILDNTGRGWLRSGTWTFQRVSSGSYDFVVELATAGTTDKICGASGIDTDGVVNCRAGKNVVINLTRWEQGTNGSTSGATKYDPATYQILAINHEVGHALGYSHQTCPSAGSPAPVMMTQYYGLNGCTPNVWPYDSSGTFLKGPPA